MWYALLFSVAKTDHILEGDLALGVTVQCVFNTEKTKHAGEKSVYFHF